MAIFCFLFAYVAWPYTAVPAAQWGGWIPIEFDAESGRMLLESDARTESPPTPGELVFLQDPATGDTFGRFRIATADGNAVRLEPIATLSSATLDQLSASFGPWSLFEADPRAPEAHYASDLADKEWLPAELFLALDPLVAISATVASRSWVWPLGLAAAVLLISLLVPRGFCGYLCPLGTTIDLFDWSIGRRIGRFVPAMAGDWRWAKYAVLAAVLVAAASGVLIAGYVAPIPLLTRALAFTVTPLQTAWERGWHQVPPWTAAQTVALLLFAAVLGLGLFRPRFWCRYLCPTGALFSLGHGLRFSQRRVTADCIECGKCVQVCPFDAIRHDYHTRVADCTFCQTCGGTCPTGAIQFASRGAAALSEKLAAPASDARRRPSRREFLARSLAAGTTGVAAAWLTRSSGTPDKATVLALAARHPQGARLPVRPPGSLPEQLFLQQCVRCGECYQACPNAVLQPLGADYGLDGLWTPRAVADWSGCEPSCNACGQVCPTGAIRALPLEEKRAARMGLAVVEEDLCLPYAGRADCRLCVDECNRAGYKAIEFIQVGTQTDASGQPIEGTGYLAPRVLAESCVGCGLCQTRCRAINAVAKRYFGRSAIRVEAGKGKEDRLSEGSYLALRQAEAAKKRSNGGGAESYLPDFLQPPP